jgi:aryl-alcohol dehydrogenase-like predicted oxidoreductase
MPLQFGILTGKFDSGTQFSDNDHRKNRVTKEIIEATNEVLENVWQLCEKYNCSKTTLALSYILHYKEISTLITGIRTTKQVETNTILPIKLDANDVKYIETLGQNELIKLMEMIQKQG